MNNISICIIAKNEEKNIGNCIKAINASLPYSKLIYEICLTDTGSTDNTIAIAKSLGATIHNYIWQNDFSAARNYTMTAARYDYILFVDSDEILENFDWDKTMALLNEYPSFVGMITRRNLCNSGDSTAITVDKVARLFNRKLYHYELSIHEQLVANNNTSLTAYDIPLTFYHEGYMGTPEQLVAKAKRNNNLLFKELEKTPDDPYIYFQIAQSYGLMSDKENQYIYFQKAYDLSPNINDVYTSELILSLGHSFIDREEYGKAINLYIKHYHELKNWADFLCFGAYAYIKSGSLIEAIAICKSALKTVDYHIEGSNNIIPNYYLGCIYETYGNLSLARDYFSITGNYSNSIEKLDTINDKLNSNSLSDNKKLSIIITANKLNDINSLIKNLRIQTMDINDMELIFIGSISHCLELTELETLYPNSIMLINIEEVMTDSELIDIAIQYASGEYINIYHYYYEYIDGLRHIYTASHNGKCDIGACDITYGDESDYYIPINSVDNAEMIKQANILLPLTNNKIYSRQFITKNNLDYTRLLDNSAILCATKIYCSKKHLL